MAPFSAIIDFMKKWSLLSLFTALTACQTAPSGHTQRGSCRVHNETYGTETFSVKVSRYAEAQPSSKAVLVLPPTGGATYLDRSISNKLCAAGFDVYILNEWTGQQEQADDLQIHDRLYKRSLQAFEAVLKMIPGGGFVGALGTSVGGTYVAVAASQIERLDAAFVIAAGAPIPGIIVHSDQQVMRDLKQRRYEKFNFKNDTDYLSALDKEFPLDPLKHDKKFQGKKLGMAIATKDTTVPVRYQRELENLWKPKPVFELESGHFWGIVGAWWDNDKDIVQFFLDASR